MNSNTYTKLFKTKSQKHYIKSGLEATSFGLYYDPKHYSPWELSLIREYLYKLKPMRESWKEFTQTCGGINYLRHLTEGMLWTHIAYFGYLEQFFDLETFRRYLGSYVKNNFFTQLELEQIQGGGKPIIDNYSERLDSIYIDRDPFSPLLVNMFEKSESKIQQGSSKIQQGKEPKILPFSLNLESVLSRLEEFVPFIDTSKLERGLKALFPNDASELLNFKAKLILILLGIDTFIEQETAHHLLRLDDLGFRDRVMIELGKVAKVKDLVYAEDREIDENIFFDGCFY